MSFEVIQGECLAEMAKLPSASIAACITDPPYGISYNPCGGDNSAPRGNFPRVVGDDQPFNPSYLVSLSCKLVLWGANHYADRLPASSSWLVWDKREGTASNDMADCEMAWSNIGGPARLFNHRWMGMIRASEMGEPRLCATQKPVALMRWCIEQLRLPKGATIVDPYCGSGSTGDHNGV